MRFLKEDETPDTSSGVYNIDDDYEAGLKTWTTIIIVLAAVFGLIVLMRWYFAGGVNTHKPDLTGKVIVVTGANTGLGFESVKFMASLNAQTVILACRSEERAIEAMHRIKKEVSVGVIEYMPLDLNDMTSVQAFAKDFNSKFSKLDILLNNAGIMALPERKQTVQGIEQQLGVNHVGHFLLTTLLMDKIKAAPQGRIVNVSSLAHEGAKKQMGGLNMKDINWEMSYVPWHVYSQSKLANVYFTKKLAMKLEEEKVNNVKVVSLHPGVVRTELGRYMATNICALFVQ